MIYHGGNIFRTSGLSIFEFNIMLLLASTVVPIDLIRKFYIKRSKLFGGV